MLSIRHFLPSSALKRHICGYYILEGDQLGDRQDALTVLPGNPILYIERQRHLRYGGRRDAGPSVSHANMTGPQTRPQVIQHTGPFRQIGVEMRAQGWRCFVESDIGEMIDKHVDVFDCPDISRRVFVRRIRDTESDQEAVTELNAMYEFLLACPRRGYSHVLDAFEDYIDAAEGPALTATAMARWFDMSTRQLSRLCHAFYGFPPKTVLRRKRFLRVIGALDGAETSKHWMDVTGEDFYDQSHFIREFKYFSGTTPTAYLNRPGLTTFYRLRHEIIGPSRI